MKDFYGPDLRIKKYFDFFIHFRVKNTIENNLKIELYKFQQISK